MRTVIYYYGGLVADFPIDDSRYDEFTRALKPDKHHSDVELGRARSLLDAFVQKEGDAPVGPTETIAACYVWHYFNTHKRGDRRIDGDVVIVDLNGDGQTIEYAAAADIKLQRM